jgi:hypothetical protein
VSEVRWCTACETASAVVTRVVRHEDRTSVAGLSATQRSTRRRFRCQACGAGFELRPVSEAVTAIVVGAILLVAATGMEIAVGAQLADDAEALAILAAIFGLFQIPLVAMIAVGVRRRRRWQRHRVVDGAPVPGLRFHDHDAADDPRRCARCGGAAPLVSKVSERVQGLPTGTAWTYRCDPCDETFVLVSPWRSMIPALIVVTALAAVIAPMPVPGFQTWWMLVGVGLVAIGVGWSAQRARAMRRRHPVVVPTAQVTTSARVRA